MAWSNSKVFVRYVKDIMDRTAGMDIDGDTHKAALYNNSITPSNTVTSANSAYNADQWATANEQSSVGQWASGGVALTSVTWTVASATVTFDATDTASGSTATLNNVYGVLVYDDTIATPVADQGVCFNYLGGLNAVTSGTFTVVWNSSGIFNIAL